MEAPALPANESARLATIHRLHILDTPAENRFDRYTRICQRLFDMPIAIITVVDRQRVWLKSAQGMPRGEAMRDIAFCGHAILGDKILEVPNTRRDLRFRNNPLVLEDPHIRFYAGAPLIAPNGHRLGTLCLIDRVPRRLSKEEKRDLTDLADMVVEEMVAYVDMDSGALNRTGLQALGSKALERMVGANDVAEFVLFDVSPLLCSRGGRVQPADRPMLIAFTEILRERSPVLKLVTHLGGGSFCAMLDAEGQADKEPLLASIVRQAAHDLAIEDEGQFLPLHTRSIRFPDVRHRSMDELIRKADAIFCERAQQATLTSG